MELSTFSRARAHESLTYDAQKVWDQRFIGASIGSATGGVPQNDRAFASLNIATQSAEYTTCAKTSPLKNPLPQVASRSANGLLAAISPADLPAVFSFCTRSRATTSMSRNLVRSALLPSGPCPGTILVLLSTKVRILSAARIIPLICPPVLASMTG